MTPATTDRGDVVHAAGFHHLSPALDARGAPAFSAAAGDGLARCGWEAYFKALAAAGLAVALDPAGPRLVPRAEARGAHGDLRGALAHTRRFWRALRGEQP